MPTMVPPALSSSMTPCEATEECTKKGGLWPALT
jgi:hypothetical protein